MLAGLIGLTAASAAFAAPTLEVVVVVGAVDDNEAARGALSGLEAELTTLGADIAVAHIDRYGKLGYDRPLRADPLSVTKVLRKRRRPVGVDHLEQLIESTKWSADGTRRIVIADAGTALHAKGRTTIEEVVFLAERTRIVVHAIDIFAADRLRSPFDAAMGDTRRFLEKPLESLGRVPNNVRHAVLQSGGTYAIVLTPPNATRRAFINGVLVASAWNVDALLAGRKKALQQRQLYGPRSSSGRDALEELASGRRRHFEYDPAELPPAIRHVDLEPLMDAVFDYVDAREVLASYVRQVEAMAEPPKTDPFGAIGAGLAKAVAGPRKLPPSRR